MKSSDFAQRLAEAGVIPEDLSRLRRVVVDAVAGESVKIYLQSFGDETLMDVDWGGLVEVPEVEPQESPLDRVGVEGV